MPHASRLVHGAVNFQATARGLGLPGLPEVFHVSARSRSIAWIFVSCNHASDRSEVFRLQANDVTWPSLVLRVHACMEVNETGHAQRLNTKTEEVVFSRRSWFSCIVGVRSELVRSYDRHLPVVVPWLNFTPTSSKSKRSAFHPPYRVGSVNFSWRKMGHAHDNIADSESGAGVREPNVINTRSEILKRKRKVEGRGRGRERKRKGEKEEGKGESEIGSEALAETGKNRKRPSRESNLDPSKHGWCSTIEPPRQATSPASLFEILTVPFSYPVL